MDTEQRLKWVENRIASSLRPRTDEIKTLFTAEKSRATLLEFLSNDDVQLLFVQLLQDDAASGGGGLRVTFSAAATENV